MKVKLKIDHAVTGHGTSKQKLATEAFVLDKSKQYISLYKTEEFSTAGDYNWKVPNGVSAINVTLVGGGGGGSFFKTTRYNVPGDTMYIFTGGNGGEVKENVIIKLRDKNGTGINEGETIKVHVGKGGTTVGASTTTRTCNGQWAPTTNGIVDLYKEGQTGEDSYIAFGETELATAKGGNSGAIRLKMDSPDYPQLYPNPQGKKGDLRTDSLFNPVGYNGAIKTTWSGGGAGGRGMNNLYEWDNNGGNGKRGIGGIGFLNTTKMRIGNKCVSNPNATLGYFVFTGGGGSYGNGKSCNTFNSTAIPTYGGGGGMSGVASGGNNGASGYVSISYVQTIGYRENIN